MSKHRIFRPPKYIADGVPQNREVLQHEQQIARFVIDECHQIFTAKNLRDCMGKMVLHGRFRIPQVHLTATMTPYQEVKYIENQKLMPDTLSIRQTTDRPELGYNVEHHPNTNSDKLAELTINTAKRIQDQTFHNRSRGIIYTRSRSKATELATAMNAACYHSNMTEQEKKENYLKWVRGEVRWMVATSGFINGIDYGYVSAIIFHEMTYGISDFLQGAGRGGRRGDHAIVLLIYSKDPPVDDPEDLNAQSDLILWARANTSCRRKTLSRLMDGVEGLACIEQPRSAPCDFCQRTASVPSSTSSLNVANRPTGFVSALTMATSSQSTVAAGSSSTPLAANSVQPTKRQQPFLPSLPNRSTSEIYQPQAQASGSSSMSTTSRQTPAMFPQSQPSCSSSQRTTANATLVARTSATSGTQRHAPYLARADVSERDEGKKRAFMASIREQVIHFQRYCVICLLLHGRYVEKPDHHWFISDCGAPPPYNRADWEKFKRMNVLPGPGLYCYYCWFPQKPYVLPFHRFPPADKNKRYNPCNMSNITSAVCYFVYRNEELYSKISSLFANIPPMGNDEEYSNWLMEIDQDTGFVRALSILRLALV